MAGVSKEQTRQRWITFADAYITFNDAIKAAKLAGYKGKTNASLSVAASRLLAREDFQELMEERRQAMKAESRLPADNLVMVRDRIAIEREDKRQFLWNLANECAKTVTTQDVAEHIDSDGNTVRTITITESVFRPREAIEAIAKLNEMDGDILPPKAPPGGGGGLSIEQLLLSITQNNH